MQFFIYLFYSFLWGGGGGVDNILHPYHRNPMPYTDRHAFQSPGTYILLLFPVSPKYSVGQRPFARASPCPRAPCLLSQQNSQPNGGVTPAGPKAASDPCPGTVILTNRQRNQIAWPVNTFTLITSDSTHSNVNDKSRHVHIHCHTYPAMGKNWSLVFFTGPLVVHVDVTLSGAHGKS